MTARKTSLGVLAATFCLGAFPLFVLTIKGWMSFMHLFCAMSCLYELNKSRLNHDRISDEKSALTPPDILVIVMLTGPTVAILLGQLWRWDWILQDYDGPFRFFLSIPIYLWAKRSAIPIYRYLEFSVPISLFLALASSILYPHSWPGARLATYFADPLTFGSISLLMGLISFVSIDLYSKDSWAIRALKLSATAIGVYLSIRSGSRSGWLAFPIVLGMGIWYRHSDQNKNYYRYLAFPLAIAVTISILTFVPVVHDRALLGLQELIAYRWSDQNPDNSVGMRVSIFRIGWFYFSESPLGGWGDQGFKHLTNDPYISTFASQFTREFPFHSGFHNEIITNLVRSGIWGGFAATILLIAPIFIFGKNLRPLRRTGLVDGAGLLGLSLSIFIVTTGMTTEVFNLKFTASFYSMMLVVFLSGISLTPIDRLAQHA